MLTVADILPILPDPTNRIMRLPNEKTSTLLNKKSMLSYKRKTLFFYIRTSQNNRKWTRDRVHSKSFKSLNRDVFKQCTPTANGFFGLLSRDFEHSFGQIFSLRVKTLGKTNLVALTHIRRERGSLPVDLRRLNEAVTMCEDRVRII